MSKYKVGDIIQEFHPYENVVDAEIEITGITQSHYHFRFTDHEINRIYKGQKDIALISNIDNTTYLRKLTKLDKVLK